MLQCCLFVIGTIACHCTCHCFSVTLTQHRFVLGKSLVEALRLSSPYRSRLFGLGTALSHPCAQDCCILLEGPHTPSKRTFLALKVRGHIETMCWGPASNAHVPGLGHQRCEPLGVSTATLVLLDFCPSGLVVCSHYSSRYSEYAWAHSSMTASWFSRGPLHRLLH